MSDERVRLTIGYIHPGMVRHEFFASMLAMYSDDRFIVSLIRKESGASIQAARNEVVRWFREEGTDEWFLFVDTDMAWHPDVVWRLLQHDVPIVSALYLGRHGNAKGFPVGQQWSTEYELNGALGEGGPMRDLTMDDLTGDLQQVGGVGMGCCLIKREVFEALGNTGGGHEDLWPFGFTEIRPPVGGVFGMGEDIAFCVRAWQKGFKSYLDSGAPVGHVKTFVITPPEIVRGAKTLELAADGEQGVHT